MRQEHPGEEKRLRTVRWAVVLPGCVTCAFGLMTVGGWIFRIPAIVQLRPGWGGMVLTTSICVALSGTALLTSLCKDAGLAGRWQQWLGGSVFLIALISVLEMVLNRNLGIDSPRLHAALLPDYPFPGRMAPNTALSFLIFGAALWLWGRRRNHGVVTTFALSIFLVGGLGFIGYCMGMQFLYGWYTSSGLIKMSLPTSVNLMLLAAGLWSLSRGKEGVNAAPEDEVHELRTIFTETTALLLITATAVAITEIGFMQTTVFRYTADHLSMLAQNDRDMIELTIDHRSERAAVAASGAWIPRQMRLWSTARLGDKNSAEEPLRSFAATLLKHGFSGVVYRGLKGRSLQVGAMIAASPIQVPVLNVVSGELIWKDGIYLSTTVPIRDEQGAIGEMLAQQPMLALDRVVSRAALSTETGALALCGRAAANGLTSCFPMRFQPAPFTMDLSGHTRSVGVTPIALGRSSQQPAAHDPLPMAMALAGKSGTMLTGDYRGRPVTAAYLPLENSALGLVRKIDTAETYAPVRRSLMTALPLTVVLILISLRTMQWRLTPLVDGLISSRAQIRLLALHDPLTGLPNRSLLGDRLRMALESGRRNRHSVALGLVDLDGFKLVNDTLGHEAGDLLLKSVARRLESCVRASDTVARMGGDEFVLVLSEIRSAEAIAVVAEKILSVFAVPVQLAAAPYTIRLSLGFALSAQGEKEEQLLMKHADAAMYAAKKSGGSRFVLYEKPAAAEALEAASDKSEPSVGALRPGNFSLT